MAAAKPIVATRIQGYSDVVTHGHQGLLAPPQDGEGLAETLSHLIKNPYLRRKLGENGRADVNQYSWQSVARKVVDYYQTTMERQQNATSKIPSPLTGEG